MGVSKGAKTQGRELHTADGTRFEWQFRHGVAAGTSGCVVLRQKGSNHALTSLLLLRAKIATRVPVVAC